MVNHFFDNKYMINNFIKKKMHIDFAFLQFFGLIDM